MAPPTRVGVNYAGKIRPDVRVTIGFRTDPWARRRFGV